MLRRILLECKSRALISSVLAFEAMVKYEHFITNTILASKSNATIQLGVVSSVNDKSARDAAFESQCQLNVQKPENPSANGGFMSIPADTRARPLMSIPSMPIPTELATRWRCSRIYSVHCRGCPNGNATISFPRLRFAVCLQHDGVVPTFAIGYFGGLSKW